MAEYEVIDKRELGRNWGWILAAGISYVILGFAALNWPITSTVTLTFALGVLLVASGVIQAVHAIQLWDHVGSAWRVCQAIVAMAAGVLMLRFPGAGMVGIAIVMSFYFFLVASAKIVLASNMRSLDGWSWGWVVLSAGASFLLGIYTIVTLPLAALWVPGFLLGIDLVIQGASLIGASMDLRYIHHRLHRPRGAHAR